MVMAITLALLTKGLYRAERLSRQAHIAFMVFYVIAALGAVAAAAAAFAVSGGPGAACRGHNAYRL